MPGAVVPFAFITGKTDTSDFRTLTRPIRTLSVREEWIYNQLAVDWAQLDGLTQKELYAMACMGKLTVHVREVFEKAAAEVLEDLDRTSRDNSGKPSAVPKRENVVGTSDLPAIMGYFDKALLDSTATNLLRLKEAADHELGRVASRSLDPPTEAELAPRIQQGFWRRLAAAAGEGRG